MTTRTGRRLAAHPGRDLGVCLMGQCLMGHQGTGNCFQIRVTVVGSTRACQKRYEQVTSHN